MILVKTVTGGNPTHLDKAINRFISDNNVEVKTIKFSTLNKVVMAHILFYKEEE